MDVGVWGQSEGVDEDSTCHTLRNSRIQHTTIGSKVVLMIIKISLYQTVLPYSPPPPAIFPLRPQSEICGPLCRVQRTLVYAVPQREKGAELDMGKSGNEMHTSLPIRTTVGFNGCEGRKLSTLERITSSGWKLYIPSWGRSVVVRLSTCFIFLALFGEFPDPDAVGRVKAEFASANSSSSERW
jgi:hypothetical protein